MKGQELNKTAKSAGHKKKMKLSVGDRIFNLVNAVITVSYTHLDVYKRQVQYPSPHSRPSEGIHPLRLQ